MLSDFQRRAGAMSLFFCLVIGSSVTLLLLCLQAAHIRAGEVNVVRAMKSSMEASLASYDKDLLKYFGIWGVESKNFSNEAFYDVLPDWQKDAALIMSPVLNSFSEDCLKYQISSHMQLRAPVGWLEELFLQLKNLKTPIPNQDFVQTNKNVSDLHLSSELEISLVPYSRLPLEISLVPYSRLPLEISLVPYSRLPLEISLVPHSMQPLELSSAPYSMIPLDFPYDFDDVMDFQSKLSEYMIKYLPQNLTMQAIRSCLEWAVSPLLDPLEEAVTGLVKKKIDEMIENCLPVYPADFGFSSDGFDVGDDTETVVPVFYDPEMIQKMSDMVDVLLTPADNFLWQKLLLSEYCLYYFPSQVVSDNSNFTFPHIDNSSADNSSDSTVVSVNRENEIEIILTGESDPKKAADRVRGNLIMVRSVIRILEVIADQNKLQSYRPLAQTFSALITAASAGSVYIDAEWIVWLLAVADAVQMAVSDTDVLINGGQIPLWTYSEQEFIKFSYNDYLRLFLLLKTEEEILRNIEFVIINNLPGNYIFAIRTDVVWNKKLYSLEASYDDFSDWYY